MSQSRTHKSIVNSSVALGFYCVTLLLNFISRKVFLNYLGTEILGLNTTALNLLQFLNLAELGISTAVGFTLYGPLAKNSRQTINEIITLQKLLYRRIAFIIIVAAVILMGFFPLIFSNISLPLWYAYASFGVLFFSALLGYFFNYRQVLLSASQQDYKIMISFKATQLLKIVFQIVAISQFRNGYEWWLILEATFAVASSIALHLMTKRTFPWLHEVEMSFKELRCKYAEFEKKIKQLFVHKLGTFALTQSSPIIIYAFTSLTTVALYGNYLIIITGVQQLIAAIFNSLTAGVGNLVTQSDQKKNWVVFDELFSIRFFLSSVICLTILTSADKFIVAWIGEEYVLSMSTLCLMVAILFINMTRYTVETFINAFGLYKDIYAPLIESVLNIGLSIVLGYFFGLNGVLSGVLISLLVIVIFWKPYFLISNQFQGHGKDYLKIYALHVLLAFGLGLITYIVIVRIINIRLTGWNGLIYQALISIALYGPLLYGSLFIARCGIVKFTKRIKNYVH